MKTITPKYIFKNAFIPEAGHSVIHMLRTQQLGTSFEEWCNGYNGIYDKNDQQQAFQEYLEKKGLTKSEVKEIIHLGCHLGIFIIENILSKSILAVYHSSWSIDLVFKEEEEFILAWL